MNNLDCILFSKVNKIKISNETKLAFWSALIFGFITHMYVITNMLFSPDSIGYYVSKNDKLTSGRWFLYVPSAISSDYTLPWVIGVLSLFYIAISVVIIINIFELKSKTSILLTSALIVTFPTISHMFSFMFTIDAYMFSMLLSCTAVWLCKKSNWGMLMGSIAVAFSVGIYQAFYSMTLVLSIMLVLKMMFDNKYSDKELVIMTLKLAAMCLVGMLLYQIILKLLLWVANTKLSSYRGIDEASISLINLKYGIPNAYKNFLQAVSKRLVRNDVKYHNLLIIFAFVLLAVQWMVLFYKSKSYKSVTRWIISLLSALCLPLFANYLMLVAKTVNYSYLMRMVYVLFFVQIVVFCEQIVESEYFNNMNFKRITALVCTAVCVLVSFNYYHLSNIGYFALYTAKENNDAVTLRIVGQIEQFLAEETQGKNNIPVHLIGRITDNPFFSDNIPTKGASVELRHVLDYNMLYTSRNTAIVSYANTILGSNLKYASSEQVDMVENEKADEIINMPLWPHKDSIKVIDGICVIKLADK